MPEGDSLYRAAVRLQPLVGLRLTASSPHPRGQVTGVARGRRRAPARERRGGGEASSAAVRGRRDGAESPAHEGPVAGRPGRLEGSRSAVARAPRGGDRGSAVERAGADARRRPGTPARYGLLAEETDPRRSWPGSGEPTGAGGRRGASGPAARRGDREHVDVGGAWAVRLAVAPLGAVSDDELLAALSGRGRRCAPRSRCAAAALGLPAGRRPCARCGTPIDSGGQGDDNRTAYWCPPATAEPDICGLVSGAAVWVDLGMAAATLALSPRYRGSELIATRRHGRCLCRNGRVARSARRDQGPGRAVRRRPRDPSRFTREARIAARLSTEPNVVTIFESSTSTAGLRS